MKKCFGNGLNRCSRIGIDQRLIRLLIARNIMCYEYCA